MSFPFDPFAECSQAQRTSCRNGLTYAELGRTAWNVHGNCTVLDPNFRKTPGYELKDADLPPWEAVAGKAAQIIDIPDDEQSAREVSAKALAKTLYMQYTVETGNEPDWKWDSETAMVQTAWEAVGRHLVNLIDSDGQTPDFSELEDRITSWAKERAQPEQVSCG
jgi:hypothetical protein